MKRRSFLTTTLFVLALAVSCNKSGITPGQDLVTMQLAASTKDCMGLYARKCLQVKMEGNPNWQLFYDPIGGFTYEEGYEYELLVKREPVSNPPADGSSIRYTLVKEVSKTKR